MKAAVSYLCAALMVVPAYAMQDLAQEGRLRLIPKWRIGQFAVLRQW